MDWDYQATTSVLQSRFIDLDQREDRRKVCQYVILEVIIAWKTTQTWEIRGSWSSNDGQRKIDQNKGVF